MKSRSSISSKNNGISGQFTSLSNNEMINLRGGEIPPIPPTGGEDFPIDLLKMSMSMSISSTTLSTVQLIPVVGKKTRIY